MPFSDDTPSRRTTLRQSNISRSREVSHLWLPQVWLYVPLYLALCIALGAACRALAHFITNPGITIDLWAALTLNSCISFGVQCGGEKVRRWSHRLRLALFIALPLGAVLFSHAILAPLDAEAEVNANVALCIGWGMLLCVLLAGSRYGHRRLPLAAPLVPGLSLFGLLNSLSVDTLIQICFLVFVAAALYIVVYEPMLHRTEARLNDEVCPNIASSRPRFRLLRNLDETREKHQQALLSRPQIIQTAVSYLAACSMWFTAFLAGAALFYYPVATVLPRVLATPFARVHSPAAALLDWRGNTSVMELRGGNYPVSNRAVMQVTLTQESNNFGNTPALWRGRTFEDYENSRWVENRANNLLRQRNSVKLRANEFVKIPNLPTTASKYPILDQGKFRLATLSPRLVHRSDIEAYIEPLQPTSSTLYTPGALIAIQSMMPTIRPQTDGSFWRNASPYAIRARVKQERISGLLHAPGLSPALLKAWEADNKLAPTLHLTPELRSQLAPIVAQIRTRATKSREHLDTPYAKANAIRSYLASTCSYSLSSPRVPATEDAVIFFMTDSKRGACDMFASSMTLLLRAMNVPARIATGYIVPDDLTGGNVTTDGSSLAGDFATIGVPKPAVRDSTSLSFTLREKDAHAWVEYFVPGAGWLTYDPTAGTRTTQMPFDDQLASLFNLPQWQMNGKDLWIPFCGLLLIGLGLSWGYFDSIHKRTNAMQAPNDLTHAQIVAAYNQSVRKLRRRVPLQPHLTPREYENAVNRAQLPTAAKQEFAALTYLLVASCYSKHQPKMTPDDLQACLQRLHRALRQ